MLSLTQGGAEIDRVLIRTDPTHRIRETLIRHRQRSRFDQRQHPRRVVARCGEQVWGMPPAAIERLGKGQPILTTGRMFQTELLPGHLRQIPQRGRIGQIHPVGRPGSATTECTITLLPPQDAWDDEFLVESAIVQRSGVAGGAGIREALEENGDAAAAALDVNYMAMSRLLYE